jgi:hypothetical protein
MANVKFCYPNWTLPTSVYTPAATGAGWLDLDKLQGEVLSEMARYPGVDPVNTRLVYDLGTLRNIDVLALPFHNAWIGDTARIKVCTDALLTDVVLDSGWREFFGEVYPYGSLPWGHPSWIDGRLKAEEAAQSDPPPWMCIAPSTVLGRYLDIYLDFSDNPDGYVDLGQVVAAAMITPRWNVSYGVKPPFYRDPSTKRRSKGGVQFSDPQRPYRTTKMALNHLSTSEAYGSFFEMVRQYGVTRPFFYIHDSDAPAAILPKQSLMVTAEVIGDLTHRSTLEYSLEVELSQAF